MKLFSIFENNGQGIVRAAKPLFAAVVELAETSRANNEGSVADGTLKSPVFAAARMQKWPQIMLLKTLPQLGKILNTIENFAKL